MPDESQKATMIWHILSCQGMDFSNKQAGSYGSGLTLRFGFNNNRGPMPGEWSLIIKAAAHLKALDWAKEIANIPDLMKRSAVHGHQYDAYKHNIGYVYILAQMQNDVDENSLTSDPLLLSVMTPAAIEDGVKRIVETIGL